MTVNTKQNMMNDDSQSQIDTLRFVFPENHRHARLEVQLRRTLRVPNDGKHHSPPTGFENFNLFVDATQEDTLQLPLYPSDAMWLSFNSPSGFPFAVQIEYDGQCAVSGRVFTEGLIQGTRRNHLGSYNLQNFLVVPEQKSFDGHRLYETEGALRQFVLEGDEKPHRLKLWIYSLKEEFYQDMLFGNAFHKNQSSHVSRWAKFHEISKDVENVKMGGGLVTEEISPNTRPLTDWDGEAVQVVTIDLIPMRRWKEVDRNEPIHTPYTKSIYERLGYPWFDHYDENNFPVLEVAAQKKVEVAFNKTEVEDKLKDVPPVDTVESTSVDTKSVEVADKNSGDTDVVPLVGSAQTPGWWEGKDKELSVPSEKVTHIPEDSVSVKQGFGVKELGSTFSFGMSEDGHMGYTQPILPIPQISKVEVVQRVEIVEKPKKESFWKRIFG